MTVFTEYLASITEPEHQQRTEEVLNWVIQTFPELIPKIAWNQPMFTDHDTYIIGFSVSKKHLAVAPEAVGIAHFDNEIVAAKYSHTKLLFRIPWESPVNYDLLEKMITFNILDKAECTTFWRK